MATNVLVRGAGLPAAARSAPAACAEDNAHVVVTVALAQAQGTRIARRPDRSAAAFPFGMASRLRSAVSR